MSRAELVELRRHLLAGPVLQPCGLCIADGATRTHLTAGEALTELRDALHRYPTVPVEVTAVALFRHARSWDEISAVEAALDTVLNEEANSSARSWGAVAGERTANICDADAAA